MLRTATMPPQTYSAANSIGRSSAIPMRLPAAAAVTTPTRVTKALCAQPERFRVRVLVRSRDKLARALAPLGMSPETLDVAEGDITDSAAVARAVVHCDAVVHCAGLYSADVTELALLRKTNVTGTQIVLDAARAAGADPVVH